MNSRHFACFHGKSSNLSAVVALHVGPSTLEGVIAELGIETVVNRELSIDPGLCLPVVVRRGGGDEDEQLRAFGQTRCREAGMG